jgi:hypothetical protein
MWRLPERRLKPVPAPAVGWRLARRNPPGRGSDALSGHLRRRTGRLRRARTYSSVNMGSPKGREFYGDGVPVVIGGVTSAQSGDRESRTTG